MSTLLIDELHPGVVFEQPIKIPRNMSIAHIRPWIYKHGIIQDGDFQLQVFDGATLLATSIINYQDFNAAFTENYAHGYIRFDFDALQLNVPDIAIDKEYILKFSMINHTLDLNNFIAIVRQYEQKIYDTYGNVIGGEGISDTIEPAGIELYEYIEV